MKLDKIDKVILRNLQQNGRMKNVNLASKVGISAPPCLRRLRFMEQKGIITGYHASVDMECLGYTVKALCVVSVSSQASEDVDAFIDSITAVENVVKCLSTAGSEFFILEIVAKSLSEYERTLNLYLQSSNIIVEIKSFIIAREHKNKHGWPI